MKRLQKTAIVTGASSGLGKAVAEQLSLQDVRVFALARNMTKTKLPEGIVNIDCDIRDPRSISQAFEIIDAKSSTIDYLIHCAGRGLVKAAEETTAAEVQDVLRTNLEGAIFVALEVYKRMVIQKHGHIVMVGSTSSIKAREMETVYCASKWGLRGFTESLRLGAQKHGVKVTGVYPGGMRSENFWKVSPGKDISGYMDPENVARKICTVLNTDTTVAVAELLIERPGK